ncbi:MAG: DUF87 domain-containing protein [archaeon]
MELFKISHGPWEKMFEGVFQGSPMEIYSNPESILLVMVFEKHGQEIEGVVVELFKAFAADGAAEGFVDTLPREIILFAKHDKKVTNKFLLLGSAPSYTMWKEDVFIPEVDSMLKKIDTATVILKDIAASYDITVLEISKAQVKVKNAFYSNPMIVFAVSSSFSGTQTAQAMPFIRGEFLVGLTKERNTVVEPLDVFFKSLAVGGEKSDRLHFLHILCESFLLSNISPVIFDTTGSFKALNSPAANRQELERYKVNSDPIGFPVKVFRPFDQIKVDLRFINPNGFCEIFGIGKSNPAAKNSIAAIIAKTLLNTNVKGMEDFIEKVKLVQTNEEINSYEIAKTARVLRLVQRNYQGLFDGSNDMEGLTMSGTRSLGMAGIIDLSGVEPKIVFLIVHNILSSALKFFRDKEKDAGKKAAFFMPELSALLARNLSNELSNEIDQMLKSLQGLGIGIAASEEKPIDVTKEISEICETKVNIVVKNDVGVQVKGRKSYRVFLRPALSMAA